MNSTQSPSDANNEWVRLIQRVVAYGVPHNPRGIRTLEILNCTSVIDMRFPVVTMNKRKMGYRFLFAEAYWILSGDNRLETISPYAKMIREFSDDGYRFQGAYGPKVTEQLRYVCETLNEDSSSRQAVISIWRESPRKSKDIPCTISLQFLIRDNKINCVATMRSSDLWLGWVYDVFNFTCISSWVALRLKEMGGNRVELGTLYLNAGSQHIYDRNMEAATDALQVGYAWSYNPLTLSSFDTPLSLMKHIECLRDIGGINDSLFQFPSSFLVGELRANGT